MADSTKPTEPPDFSGNQESHEVWCTEYVHHWTGKRMVASDYGYHAWHFRKKTGRSTK
jgi:hypothetical protein